MKKKATPPAVLSGKDLKEWAVRNGLDYPAPSKPRTTDAASVLGVSRRTYIDHIGKSALPKLWTLACRAIDLEAKKTPKREKDKSE